MRASQLGIHRPLSRDTTSSHITLISQTTTSITIVDRKARYVYLCWRFLPPVYQFDERSGFCGIHCSSAIQQMSSRVETLGMGSPASWDLQRPPTQERQDDRNDRIFSDWQANCNPLVDLPDLSFSIRVQQESTWHTSIIGMIVDIEWKWQMAHRQPDSTGSSMRSDHDHPLPLFHRRLHNGFYPFLVVELHGDDQYLFTTNVIWVNTSMAMASSIIGGWHKIVWRTNLTKNNERDPIIRQHDGNIMNSFRQRLPQVNGCKTIRLRWY